MKIAVVGAGFTGLSAAYQLLKQGLEVEVFEKNDLPGGLACGFKENAWQWAVEKYYHHIFASDFVIKAWAKEIGVPIFFKRPKTKSLIENKIYPLDSPLDVLMFPKLSFFEKMRMGFALAYLKLTPFWQAMEKTPVSLWLPRVMGEKAYSLLWEPLLSAKFGSYKEEIPLSWFWARIKKRSARLGYPEGGFQNLANKLKDKIEVLGGKFYFQTEVTEIRKGNNKISLLCSNDLNHSIKSLSFDKVIITIPSPLFMGIIKDLPSSYLKNLKKLKMLSALNLVLILKKPFLKDGTYWLNICNKDLPFLSIVEHTNFIDSSFYNNEHIVYVGNYLPYDHPYMKMTADELLKIYDPFLKKINSTYHLSPITYHLFSDPFAQPVIPINYSKIIPPFETPLKNVYLANMQQVYPWDRGVNYAVELGKRVAKLIKNES